MNDEQRRQIVEAIALLQYGRFLNTLEEYGGRSEEYADAKLAFDQSVDLLKDLIKQT